MERKSTYGFQDKGNRLIKTCAKRLHCQNFPITSPIGDILYPSVGDLGVNWPKVMYWIGNGFGLVSLSYAKEKHLE